MYTYINIYKYCDHIIVSYKKNKFSKKVKIGVTGLNPHCESVDRFNEDQKILKPAIKYLTKLKSNTRFKVIFRNKNFGMTSNWYFAYKYMYACMHVCMCMYVRTYLFVYACTCVSTAVYMYECLHRLTYECMHVLLYVRMHVCMYVCIM